jgi:beta-lactamase class D
MKVKLISVCVFASILYSCSPNNVEEDKSLGKYFTENKVVGCFGLYNNATNEFTFYNKKRFTDSSYLPASTFKIVNSLIGLQTGVISSDSMIIKWDGVKRNVKNGIKIFQCMKHSVFQLFLITRKLQEELVKTGWNIGWILLTMAQAQRHSFQDQHSH